MMHAKWLQRPNYCGDTVFFNYIRYDNRRCEIKSKINNQIKVECFETYCPFFEEIIVKSDNMLSITLLNFA